MEMEMKSKLERKQKTTTTNIQPTVRNGSIERKNPISISESESEEV